MGIAETRGQRWAWSFLVSPARAIYEGDAPGLASYFWWWRRTEAKWTHSGTHPAASRAGSSPGQDKLRVVCPIGCCLRTSRSADSDAKGKKKMWRVDEMVWCRGGACVEHLLPVVNLPGPRRRTGWRGGMSRAAYIRHLLPEVLEKKAEGIQRCLPST